jgi:hypothetical protein
MKSRTIHQTRQALSRLESLLASEGELTIHDHPERAADCPCYAVRQEEAHALPPRVAGEHATANHRE